MEVCIDPHSLFWKYRDPVDPNGDPLELLIRAEEGEEGAVELIRNDGFHYCTTISPRA